MKKINAMEMIRRIRDRQSKETAGKSPEEMIEYFRRKARKFAKQGEAPELSEHGQ